MILKRTYKIETKLLTQNVYSRPGSKMLGVEGIAIHWVGNPGTSAMANRNYFENLKNQSGLPKGDEPKRYASSHEVIGQEGEVVACIPKDEVAYHVGAKSYKPRARAVFGNQPNRYLYGIETCHPDWVGKFSEKTYNTLVERVADLLIDFNLVPSKDTIWRHFDVTGKDCPRFYMSNPGAWDELTRRITKKYKEKVEGLLVKELLQWQKDMGNKSLDSLNKKKDSKGNIIVNSPETWKETLAEDLPQWLFWSIVDRITK